MSPWTGEAASLAARIRAFVDSSLQGAPSEPFEALALDLADFQRRHDPVAAALTLAAPARWEEIPAVPVDLFKSLPVGTVREGEPHHAFRTSGTTQGTRGVHRMRSTALYDHGALAWARKVAPDAPPRVLALLGDPAVVPDSSLSHMVALFGPARWFWREDRVDVDALHAALAAAPAPVYLATTAFALAEWLSGSPRALPAGSTLMVTGGFKGRVHKIEGEALYAEAEAALRPARILTEYGMTELSSQLWGTPSTPFAPPPWLRALAVDPITATPLPPETPGQLRFYDLCNLDGALGVETLDEGIVHADGRVTLRGRLPGAAERGCSLTVEEAWAKRGLL